MLIVLPFEKLKRTLWRTGEVDLEVGYGCCADEPTPKGKGSGAERAFSVQNYGMNTWGDLFNARQEMALLTFVKKVKVAYQKMRSEGVDGEYAKAVVSYLRWH